jgi:hypothetical protein
MNVGRQVQASTVPWLGGVVRHVGIVANQCPAWEVLEDGALVAMEHSDVDIPVIACLLPEPGIGSPPTAEEPRSAESAEQVAHVRDGFRHGRRRFQSKTINHRVKLAPHPRSAQPNFRPHRDDAAFGRHVGAIVHVVVAEPVNRKPFRAEGHDPRPRRARFADARE